jgi:hypothetical protein
VPDRFSWNYTTFLNLVALGVLAVLFWLYGNRDRFGSNRYAIDPMCGMQVDKGNAPASVVRDGHSVWFCSDHCRERYEQMPEPRVADRR